MRCLSAPLALVALSVLSGCIHLGATYRPGEKVEGAGLPPDLAGTVVQLKPPSMLNDCPYFNRSPDFVPLAIRVRADAPIEDDIQGVTDSTAYALTSRLRSETCPRAAADPRSEAA